MLNIKPNANPLIHIGEEDIKMIMISFWKKRQVIKSIWLFEPRPYKKYCSLLFILKKKLYVYQILSIQGTVPTFVMATAGTTVLGAYDELTSLADVCSEFDVWLHCDVCIKELWQFIIMMVTYDQ